MLTLEGLRVELGEFSLCADFGVARGDRVALMGPSGAGKSTLINTIAGFQAPASGRVLWNGQDLARAAPGARPFSILFQDGNLFPHLTAAENVGLAIRLSLQLTSAETEQVTGALARVGLAGFGDRKPAALSGGQQSRVALARVLLMARPLVLLDEPFAALGPALKDEMLSLVADVLDVTDASLIMATHEPEDARRIARATVFVADGTAAAPVATEALFDDPPAALQAYFGHGLLQ
jgi:thiamine transport system ATP-binding protein